ncbi:Arsenate reductase [Alphaproteobacteria bacterium SO-S41]|nr:Arsenate reductase [Alphaproteobacteria bacterium SO-S41]
MERYNVLFLCTGNSARSILAEVIADRFSFGKLKGFSAGSFPKGEVHPLTLKLLAEMNLPTEGLRSKPWDEFAADDAPRMDFVFTVCDQAGGEVCPIWPGQPMKAHWGIPDPAAATGTEAQRMKAFREAFVLLKRRIELFASLPIASLDRLSLKAKADAIGAGEAVPAL